MTKVAILPVSSETKGLSYQGVSGEMRSEGRTPGEALDALTRQFTKDKAGAEAGMLIVVQGLHPDRFFGADQQQRLAALMADWRASRDRRQTLAPAEQEELNALVKVETDASAARAVALADELRP